MGLRLVVLNLVSGLVCHVSWSSGHPERPKTQCELHRDSLQGGLSPRGPRPVPGGLAPGAFVPQCDEQGQYRALQCHSSTGHCWCVDSRGQERAGTRTLPRTPPTNCDGPGETCSETQHITCTHLLNTLFKETALKKKGNVFNGVEKMCFSHKVENSSTFVLPVSGDKPHIISLRKKGDMIKRGTLWCVETRRSEGPFYTKEICEVRSAV